MMAVTYEGARSRAGMLYRRGPQLPPPRLVACYAEELPRPPRLNDDTVGTYSLSPGGTQTRVGAAEPPHLWCWYYCSVRHRRRHMSLPAVLEREKTSLNSCTAVTNMQNLAEEQ